MTLQKQTILNSWLLGLAATAATGSVLFAWNTNAKLSVLMDHDAQHTTTEAKFQQKQDDLQISQFDIKTRITRLEDQIKTP